MKITKKQLVKIIKEEKAKLATEQRVRNTVRSVLLERKLDPAQIMMLTMTLRNAGADVPELKKAKKTSTDF